MKKIACFKRLSSTAKIPEYATVESAGADLYANINEPLNIMPHETAKIGTGLAITPPEGMAGFIVARSGLATKKGLAPANKIGICDYDYTGEYIVALHNHSDIMQTVQPQERIAQLLFMPYCQVNFIEVEELKETLRGSGGFSSTGTTIIEKNPCYNIDNPFVPSMECLKNKCIYACRDDGVIYCIKKEMKGK